MPVAFPRSKDEQASIAHAAAEIEAFISSLESLISKKRAIKQAAMQELLTGKRRLPGVEGEWVVKRLGDITSIDPESLGNNTHPNCNRSGGWQLPTPRP
jgi:type I restriction enzyme S subunit